MAEGAYYNFEKKDGFWRIGSAEEVFSYLIPGSEKAIMEDMFRPGFASVVIAEDRH